MTRILALGLMVVFALPLSAWADNQLIVQQSIEIKASPKTVWELVKNFDAIAKWHPAFTSDVIKAGKNNTKGAIRTLTLSSGESFDEQLLKFDDSKMFFRYRIVGDSPFPVTHYVSTLTVKKFKGGMSKVIWQGKFNPRPDSGKSEDETVETVNAAYRTGLENLKVLIESGHS